MAGKLRIDAPHVVTAGAPFDCVVRIQGALAGDTVRIRLRQTAGVQPLYDQTEAATIDHLGGGTARYLTAVLNGPCVARLVADDVESVQPLAQDDDHIQVVAP